MSKKVLVSITIIVFAFAASIATILYFYRDDFAPKPVRPKMDNGKIPQYVWDTLVEKLDYDEDNELRVSDAIRKNKTSDIICDIIYDGRDVHISLIDEPLDSISDRIRKQNDSLLAVWRVDNDAYFLFFNEDSGKPCILHNSITTPKIGFIDLWDQDGDGAVTEKDAARFWQDQKNSFMALAISSYAQFGEDVFPATTYKDGNAEDELTELIRCKDGKYNPVNIAYIDDKKICVFDYKNKAISYVYY